MCPLKELEDSLQSRNNVDDNELSSGYSEYSIREMKRKWNEISTE